MTVSINAGQYVIVDTESVVKHARRVDIWHSWTKIHTPHQGQVDVGCVTGCMCVLATSSSPSLPTAEAPNTRHARQSDSGWQSESARETAVCVEAWSICLQAGLLTASAVSPTACSLLSSRGMSELRMYSALSGELLIRSTTLILRPQSDTPRRLSAVALWTSSAGSRNCTGCAAELPPLPLNTMAL